MYVRDNFFLMSNSYNRHDKIHSSCSLLLLLFLPASTSLFEFDTFEVDTFEFDTFEFNTFDEQVLA